MWAVQQSDSSSTYGAKLLTGIERPPLTRWAQPSVLLLESFLLSGLALVGLAVYASAGVSSQLLPSLAGPTAGNHLLGFLVFLTCGPAALWCLFTALQRALVVWRKTRVIILLFCIVLSSLAIGYMLGLYMFNGRDSLQCGFIFCWMMKEPFDMNSLPMTVTAMGCVITVTAVFVLEASRRMYFTSRAQADDSMYPTEAVARARRLHARGRRISFAVLLLLLPLCCVFVGIMPPMVIDLPPHGESFYKYARSVQHPEDPGAWMTTINVHVSEIVVKLYPDTLLFYGVVEVFLIAGFLCSEVRGLERLRTRRMFTTKWFGTFNVGDVLSFFLLAIFYTLFTVYWAHDHHPHGTDKPEAHLARVLGMIAVVTMGLLLLPVTKNSKLLQAAGVSWESSLWMHVLLGTCMMVLTVGHIVFWVQHWVTGVQSPIPPDFPTEPPYPAFGQNIRKGTIWDILPFRVWWQECGGDWTVSTMTTINWGALLAFGVLPWFRRDHYKLFRFAHSWYAVFVPMVALHAASGWFFLVPGVLLWVLDFLLRLSRGSEKVNVVHAVAHKTDTVELRFEWPGARREHSPAMFVLVNCPQISCSEWHPFSLSSSPLDELSSLHIQVSNRADRLTWTRRLHSLVQTLGNSDDLILHLDGPYGPDKTFSRTHRRVLLVAGGIGITPCQNALRYLQLQPRGVQHARLAWVARSPELFNIFQSSLLNHDNTPRLQTSVDLYCSRTHLEHCNLGPILQERPNLPEILRQELNLGPTSVRVCGPESLVVALREAVEGLPVNLQRRCHLEEWSFEF